MPIEYLNYTSRPSILSFSNMRVGKLGFYWLHWITVILASKTRLRCRSDKISLFSNKILFPKTVSSYTSTQKDLLTFSGLCQPIWLALTANSESGPSTVGCTTNGLPVRIGVHGFFAFNILMRGRASTCHLYGCCIEYLMRIGILRGQRCITLQAGWIHFYFSQFRYQADNYTNASPHLFCLSDPVRERIFI